MCFLLGNCKQQTKKSREVRQITGFLRSLGSRTTSWLGARGNGSKRLHFADTGWLTCSLVGAKMYGIITYWFIIIKLWQLNQHTVKASNWATENSAFDSRQWQTISFLPHVVHRGSVTHPASYSTDWVLLLGVKQPGQETGHPSPS